MHTSFGPIALMGSGETALAGGRIFESIAARLPQPLHVAILETPAGFELNSAQVAGRLADFIRTRLQNFQVRVDVVPARKLGSSFSPDDRSILDPLLRANMIFMGPGSPTYAVRNLKGTLTWDILRARHRLGAALIFASAATIAVGAYSLPVYEIYKVGEDVSCPPGLNLFSDFGLALSCIPHWNNTDGGVEVDTSRCFIGMERFSTWCNQLPPGQTVLGLDEHTGIVIDFAAGTCKVGGVSSVTLLRKCDPLIFPSGCTFPVSDLGSVHCPDRPDQGIPTETWMLACQAEESHDARDPGEDAIPPNVQELVDARSSARSRKDWAAADILRRQIESHGWMVQDTVNGQTVVRQS